LQEAIQDVEQMNTQPAHTRAFRRMPAILTTCLIEYAVVLLIAFHSNVIVKHPLLVAFTAMNSAISGNIGLQASTINVRALSHGLKDPSDLWGGVAPEVASGAIMAIIMAVFLGLTSAATHHAWGDGSLSLEEVESAEGAGIQAGTTWEISSTFGMVIAIGVFFTSTVAALTGSAAPLFFKACMGVDPASWAGPLETAVQDIVGNCIILFLGEMLLMGVPTC
jgi:magnesium transporter